jgi:hypothetical protein
MKINSWVCALLLFGWIAALAQNKPASSTPPESEAAQLKEQWHTALSEVQHEFQNNNDRESADWLGTILDSLDQPGGMSVAAQAANGAKMKARVRELVRKGALESAAKVESLQLLLIKATGAANPNHPETKTGGKPGPGGLVLYLPFDRTDENGTVRDESGAGNDGRVSSAKWVAAGRFGGAYQFSLTNLTDRIVIPNSDTLNPDFITLAAWIKTSDQGGIWSRILDKVWENGYCLSTGGDNRFAPFGKSFRGDVVFDANCWKVSERSVDDGRWHHVAGAYDGKEGRIYVDGVECARKTFRINGEDRPMPANRRPGALSKNTWNLCVGNSVDDEVVMAFDGMIDEVRIYNRALSADEIKLLAQANHAGVDIVPAPSTDSSGKPDAAARLKKLQSLYEQGLIIKASSRRKEKKSWIPCRNWDSIGKFLWQANANFVTAWSEADKMPSSAPSTANRNANSKS